MPDVRFSNALIRYRDRDKESWRPKGYLSEESDHYSRKKLNILSGALLYWHSPSKSLACISCSTETHPSIVLDWLLLLSFFSLRQCVALT